jgi:hypothetical protein
MNDNMIEKLKEYLDSPEGKESTRKFIAAQNFEHNIFKPKWIGKIKEKIDEHGADAVIEYLINKYRNDKYRDREWKCRREPEEKLLYYLFYYAQEHCAEATDDKHYGMFVSEAYIIGSYVIQLLLGQGSFVALHKLEELQYD